VRALAQRMTELSTREGREGRQAARTFRRQVERGDYAAVFSASLTALLEQAAEAGDLRSTIGALRIAERRLLLEEESPSRMAHGLARIAQALGRALEQQAAFEGRRESGTMGALLAEWMGEIQREREEFRPWEVDPQEPGPTLSAQMRAEGIEPGTFEGLLWVQQWQAEAMAALLAQGDAVAIRVWELARGGGDGMLGSGTLAPGPALGADAAGEDAKEG
jgi:hypothetical protein